MNRASPEPRPPGRPLRWPVHLLLHAIAGGCLLLAGVLLGRVPDWNLFWHSLSRPLVAAGCVWILIAGFHRRQTLARLTAGLSLSVIVVFASLGSLEIGFRLARHDFRQQEAVWKRLPPFVRRPFTPLDGAVFVGRAPTSGPDRSSAVTSSIRTFRPRTTTTNRSSPFVTTPTDSAMNRRWTLGTWPSPAIPSSNSGISPSTNSSRPGSVGSWAAPC